MPIVLLSKADEEYLRKCAAQLDFAYGLIIGQQAEPEKYVIVHLAKNSEEDVDLPAAQGEGEGAASSHGPQKVDDIDLQTLTNQWLSASKMIPGSFDVLGVFVASVRSDFLDDQSDEFKSAKRLFYDLHNLLIQGNHFRFAEDNATDYLYVAYSSTMKKAVCKIYNYVTNGGSFSPLDYRIVEKPFEWHTFECSYEMDDVFPILDAVERINIETQFQKTIDSVRKCLAASEIFIQNESVDDGQTLETYIRGLKDGHKHSESEECYKASIFLPVKCQISRGVHPIKVREFNGTIRLSGVISSRIWCNPKNTLADVKRFLREDILRSLTARIQVYCDGLTEPNISSDAIFISEPPRRVYFNLATTTAPTAARPIQFSEYIFRGEAATVAVAQAKQILDLDIGSDSIVADLEGVPEDETFSDTSFEMATAKATTTQLADHLSNAHDLTRTMYMLGISVSLLVLVISIAMHYILK